MKEAMEHYFSIEPFGSLREYFDVVAIKAVSKHSQLNQECAFLQIQEVEIFFMVIWTNV